MSRYVDLLTDFSFKRIFGVNKDLLLSLLNAIFDRQKVITDISWNKNESPGDIEEIGGVIFDLLCTGKDGEQFLIEVQRSNQGNLKQRMLYYASRLISDMAPKGKRKEWNYNIKAVYVIVLMDGFCLTDSPSDIFLHNICLSYKETNKIFYDGFNFIYIELPKFIKNENVIQTYLDRWIYALKNTHKLEDVPKGLQEPIFQKLFEVAEYSNLNKEDKKMYDVELKRKWDNANVLAYAKENARNEGLQEGRNEGLKEGRTEGRTEGRKEGRKEGNYEARKDLISKFLKSGKITAEEIALITEEPLENILKIKNELSE